MCDRQDNGTAETHLLHFQRRNDSSVAIHPKLSTFLRWAMKYLTDASVGGVTRLKFIRLFMSKYAFISHPRIHRRNEHVGNRADTRSDAFSRPFHQAGAELLVR